jgi:hypothetical protein
LYQRAGLGSGFAWYQGGVHSNTQNDPGAGGTTLMTLDSSGNLKVTGSGAYAVWGNNPNGGGVYGSSGSGFGVYGSSASASGVEGHSGSGYGVYGESSGAGLSGVYGISHSDTGFGVVGETYAAHYSNSGGGVTGIAHTSDYTYGTGVRGIDVGGHGWAGYFTGSVEVTGDLYVDGTKHFKIDHPLAPASKYLIHASIESPDVKNLYDGNVTTDANGEAIVALPTYFEVLNRDFRYQLTAIGQFAQAIVSSKIKGNQFTIKTDKPNVEVSWQVTGIRQDAYMKAHPMVVEQDKPANERGTYQHPELFGQPEEKGLSWSQNPELWKRLKKERVEQAALPKP